MVRANRFVPLIASAALLFASREAAGQTLSKTLVVDQLPGAAYITAVCLLPEILITSMTSSPPAGEFEKYIKLLSADFPQATILMSGLRLRKTATRIPNNVRPYYQASELPALLKEIS